METTKKWWESVWRCNFCGVECFMPLEEHLKVCRCFVGPREEDVCIWCGEKLGGEGLIAQLGHLRWCKEAPKSEDVGTAWGRRLATKPTFQGVMTVEDAGNLPMPVMRTGVGITYVYMLIEKHGEARAVEILRSQADFLDIMTNLEQGEWLEELFKRYPTVAGQTDEKTMGRALVNKTFGEAIEALKQGKRVAREGWNGKGMFLFLLPAGTIPKSAIHDPALKKVLEDNGKDHFEALGSIRMKTADDKILTGWLASQTDMLAEDWMVYED